MIRLSACLELLFTEEEDFARRIEWAAREGFPAVEFWSYDDKDLRAVKAAAEGTGVTVAGIVLLPIPSMVDRSQKGAFLDGLKLSVEAAHQVGCSKLIVLAGNELSQVSRQEQLDSVVACLEAGAPIAAEEGIILCLEPLNALIDHKGYFLNRSDEGFEVVRRIGSPNVRLLFDIYHQQVTEGNVTANLTANVDQVAHVHVADVPGRGAPGTGELNWRNVLNALDDAGYRGYVGLEYIRKEPTLDGLRHIQEVVAEINAGSEGR